MIVDGELICLQSGLRQEIFLYIRLLAQLFFDLRVNARIVPEKWLFP